MSLSVYKNLTTKKKMLQKEINGIRSTIFVNLNIALTFVAKNGFVYMYHTEKIVTCEL